MTTLRERIRAAVVGLRTGEQAVVPRRTTKAAKKSDVRLWPDYRNTQPLWTLTDIQSFIDYGYNINAVINAACNYRADAVTTAQLRGYSGDQDQPEPLPVDDPLSLLLERPNRFLSGPAFHALNSVLFSIAGQSFIWLKRERPGEVPMEMFTLRPDWVKIVPALERGGEVVGYVYTPSGDSIVNGYPMLPEDVIHVKRPNPSDPLMGAGYGFSSLGAAAQSANVDNDVTKFLKVFFQSGAMFQNMVTFDVPMEPDDISRVRERLEEIYGGVENWAKWGVMDQGAKFNRVSPTFDEMGFDSIDSRNEARILGALGVPPILVGMRLGLERSTYSNYEEARKQFWEDRLLPELRLFRSEYNHFLGGDGRLIQYDTSDVPALRKDIGALAEAAKKLVDTGVPPRLAFMTVGLDVPAYDGDMERYINTGGGSVLTPAAVAANAEEATAAAETGTKQRIVERYDPQAMGVKMDAIAQSWEERYGDKAVELFKIEQADISAMLTEMQKAAYREKAMPDWDRLMQTIEQYYAEQGYERKPETWREEFVPLLEGTMQDAGQEWATVLGVDWTVRDLAGEAWFQDYVLKFANPITEGSSKQIHDLFAQGKADGWTVPQAQDALDMLFQQWMNGDLNPTDWEWVQARLPDYRRENIARTESIRASGAGTLNLGKSWGAERKFWIATFGDDRTRDSHLRAGADYSEQRAIPIDEDFMVGGVAMGYPGDPKGTPREFCNCRCALGLLMD